MWKICRLCLACLVLVGFVFLFLDQSEHSVLATDLAWLAKIQLVPAIVAGSVGIVFCILAVTLVYGRIYCSLVCPLGLLQDVLLSFRKKRSYRFQKALPLLRYGLAILFFLSLALGLPIVFDALEPYSAFGRIMSSLGEPIATLVNNGLDFISQGKTDFLSPKPFFIHGQAALILAVLTLVLLIWMSTKGRVWCNTICPVGTLLGFLSKFALFRPRIDKNACTHCGQCARHCKANCIDSHEGTIDASRCISCYNCLDACAFHALSLSATKEKTPHSPSMERRAAITAIGLGTLGLVAPQNALSEAKKSEAEILALAYKDRRDHKSPLLPAGAISLNHFMYACTACQLCVAACPSRILSSFDHGYGLFQPELGFERGFCRPECVVCGTVCPTGAITRKSIEEKSVIQIGRASVDYERCVVRKDNVPCTACQRNCPTEAISLVGEDKLKVPSVNPEKCIGCGACEFFCPARPVAAITVEANISHRIL